MSPDPITNGQLNWATAEICPDCKGFGAKNRINCVRCNASGRLFPKAAKSTETGEGAT